MVRPLVLAALAVVAFGTGCATLPAPVPKAGGPVAARMRVACRVYRGEEAAPDREFLSRAELTLSPVQYGQPWLGLVRFEFAPGGSLHRAALDADDWAGVSARLEPLLLADLSRRVAGVLAEVYRQPKEEPLGAQAP